MSDLPASPPSHLGPYRLEERLGSGGMGRVFRAFDQRLRRWVAIKQLPPDRVADGPRRERFRREARAAARLNHPAVVQVFDLVDDGEDCWIVMELVQGTTLKNNLELGLELPAILRLAAEIADGLATAHRHGLIHRDLKVENVIVTPQRRAKVLDFGLVKRFHTPQDSDDSSESSLSLAGAVPGTSRVMSPEQAMGLPLDGRTDLFSLGVLLYEAVTGVSPFRGPSELLTLARICTHRQPPARELDASLPEELSRLIDQLLGKDLDERPEDAAAVAVELRRLAAATAPGELYPRRRDRAAGDVVDVRPAVSVPGAAAETRAGPIRVKTLLYAELLGPRGSASEERQVRLARDLALRFDGVEIERKEGWLLLFERPSDAVAYAVAYHVNLAAAEPSSAGPPLLARIGIHLGEVLLRRNPPESVSRGAPLIELEGLAKSVVTRMTALAEGGETLLSEGAFELSHRALAEISSGERELRWADYGRHVLSGIEVTVRIYEVRLEKSGPVFAEGVGTRRRAAAGGLGDARGKRHLGRPAAALVLAAAVALAAAVFLRQPEPARSTAPALAVLDLVERGGPGPQGWLGPALAELVAGELAAGRRAARGRLRVLRGEQLDRLVARQKEPPVEEDVDPEELPELARGLGVEHLVLGSWHQGEDGRVELELRLFTARGGRGATIRDSAPLSDLPALASRLAAAIDEGLPAASDRLN